MAFKWTKVQVKERTNELVKLYCLKNLSIKEISKILGISESGVYRRAIRLKIKTHPELKNKFRNQRHINLPKYSDDLAEFTGILLGDGHLSKTQLVISLGLKEFEYLKYIVFLFKNIFKIKPKFMTRNSGHRDIYFGSVTLVRFFKSMGLVENKVASQVGIPKWISTKRSYQRRFLRGLFDTDGSIYKLKFGDQISLCNRSFPLLKGARLMLLNLNYKPSQVSGYNIYLTKRDNLLRFANEIGSSNRYKRELLKNMK